MIQPCFEQQRDQNREIAKATGVQSEFNSPFSGATFGTGRVDLVLLRDCDVQGGKEIATNLHFFRFQLDFSAAPAPNGVRPGPHKDSTRTPRVERRTESVQSRR